MYGSPCLQGKHRYGGSNQTDESTLCMCFVCEQSEQEQTTQASSEEPEKINELIPKRLDVAACEDER